jgi:hypothetical protein
MDMVDMDNLSTMPQSFPRESSTKDKLQWLTKISKRMVERIWVQTPIEDIKIATTAYQDVVLGTSPAAAAAAADPVYPHCVCGIGE